MDISIAVSARDAGTHISSITFPFFSNASYWWSGKEKGRLDSVMFFPRTHYSYAEAEISGGNLD